MFLKSCPSVLKPSLLAGLRGIKASGGGDTVTVACASQSTGSEHGAWHHECSGLWVRSTILPAQPRSAPAPDKPLPGCWGDLWGTVGPSAPSSTPVWSGLGASILMQPEQFGGWEQPQPCQSHSGKMLTVNQRSPWPQRYCHFLTMHAQYEDKQQVT